MLVAEFVHQVCAKPGGECSCDCGEGNDAPVDEVGFARIVGGADEGDDDDAGEGGGNRLFLLEFEQGDVGGDHDDASAYTTEGSE